jgi:hypothetical protein
MVAVGGADDRQLLGERLVRAGGQIRTARQGGGAPLDLRLQQPQHGIGAAQRLEALQAEAAAFVLVVQAGDAQFAGQPVKPDQRRDGIARPCGYLGARRRAVRRVEKRT